MRGLIAYRRSCWRGLGRPAQLDADMQDEMRFHIDMEADRLRQRGIDPAEATRRAALAFGGIEKFRGAGRDALGFTWARGLSVDVKLGLRMLGKYPGITCIALLALSLAIGAGAAYLEFITDLFSPRLAFADGARIVGIQNRDAQTGKPDDRSTSDFVRWRGSLTSLDELGAFRGIDRNLISSDGRSEVVPGAEISASAFRMLRVPPQLGRPLVEADEAEGAPAVVVIGHDLWQARFAGDASVLGQTVRLGPTPHTIVGVMPAGFAFPVSHSLWVPLRLNGDYPRRQGPALTIFGRLAADSGLRQAQAELDALAALAAREFPDTHQHLRPQIKPYVESLWSAEEHAGLQYLVLYSANLLFVGFLGVCGANIATLVFARTAMRGTEISVRTALGASRARIAGQMFAEGLVLSALAAALGLLVASYGSHWVKNTLAVAQGMRIMFWWDDGLSAPTLAYAAVLAIGAAVVLVLFEDLVMDTEATMRRLAMWLGISFQPSLLAPTFNRQAIKANSSFQVEGHGVVKSPLDRWRTVLSEEDAATIDRHTRDLYLRAQEVAARQLA